MASKPSDEYWRDRAEETERIIRGGESKPLRIIETAYRNAGAAMAEDSARILYNYAQRYSLTEAEAAAMLAAPVSVEEYNSLWRRMQAFEFGSPAYMELAKYAATRAASFRMTNADAMRDAMAIELARAAAKQEGATTDYLREAYGIASDRTIQDLSKRLGVEVSASMPAAVLDEILKRPWSANGVNYSTNIWQNAGALQTALEEILTPGLMAGNSVDNIARAIAKRLGVAFSSAKRLVRTETTYVLNQASLTEYQRAGVEKYQFMATLDDRTSEICQALDGEVFYVDQAAPGLNLPPMHPNCRSTTVAVVDAAALENAQRIAKDEQGGYYYVPRGTKYPDYYESTSGRKWFISKEVSRRIENAMGTVSNNQRHIDMDDFIAIESSGARIVTGAKHTEGWDDRHADRYYEAIRNHKPYTDANHIAEHTSFTADQIELIRLHIFVDEHDLTDGRMRFNTDFDQAQAWQRLVEGKDIWPSDITFLQHELHELTLIREKGYTYDEAHTITNKIYNWDAALQVDLEKHRR